MSTNIYTTLPLGGVTSSFCHFTVARLRQRVIRAPERLQNQVLPILVMERPVGSGGSRIYEKKDGITRRSTSTKTKKIETSILLMGSGCYTKTTDPSLQQLILLPIIPRPRSLAHVLYRVSTHKEDVCVNEKKVPYIIIVDERITYERGATAYLLKFCNEPSLRINLRRFCQATAVAPKGDVQYSPSNSRKNGGPSDPAPSNASVYL